MIFALCSDGPRSVFSFINMLSCDEQIRSSSELDLQAPFAIWKSLSYLSIINMRPQSAMLISYGLWSPVLGYIHKPIFSVPLRIVLPSCFMDLLLWLTADELAQTHLAQWCRQCPQGRKKHAWRSGPSLWARQDKCDFWSHRHGSLALTKLLPYVEK